MPSIKGLLIASLSCLGDRFTFKTEPQPLALDDVTNFAELPTQVAIPREFRSALSSIPTETLHSILHKHLPNFKDGIFERDHTAVEEIYKRSPDMANKLVAAARYDVLRRQNGNITTTSRPPVPTTTRPVTLTQTNAQGSTYLTTFTPVGGVFTSQVFLTSTAQDGSRSTYTSFTVVPAPTQAGSSTSPGLTGDAPIVNGPLSLQGVLVLMLATFGAFMA